MIRLHYRFCLTFSDAFPNPNEDEKEEYLRKIVDKAQATSMWPSVINPKNFPKFYEQASIPPIKIILQLHVDSQVVFDPRLYFMYLGARIRTTKVRNTIERLVALNHPYAVYVIVLLHSYLQCGDALILKGMPRVSNGPSLPMFTLAGPRSHQYLVVPDQGWCPGQRY